MNDTQQCVSLPLFSDFHVGRRAFQFLCHDFTSRWFAGSRCILCLNIFSGT